jgi:hypothetical protein
MTALLLLIPSPLSPELADLSPRTDGTARTRTLDPNPSVGNVGFAASDPQSRQLLLDHILTRNRYNHLSC